MLLKLLGKDQKLKGKRKERKQEHKETLVFSSSWKHHKTETVIHGIVMTDRIFSKFTAYEHQIYS